MRRLSWILFAGIPAVVGCDGAAAPTTCPTAEVTYRADPVGVEVQFVLDRSGSMHLPIDNQDTRWTATKYALFTFLDRLQYRARAGVTMFPAGDEPIDCCPVSNPNCGACTSDIMPSPENRCSAGTYFDAAPEILTPEIIAGLHDRVNASDSEHYWGTPLAAALSGASAALEKSDAEHRVLVLFTDGKPTACETTVATDANDITFAVDAVTAAADVGVRTYVVGLVDGFPAADASHLSAIATAGETARYVGCQDNNDCAYAVHQESFSVDVNAALASIAADAASCTYEMPQVRAAKGEPVVSIEVGDKRIEVPRDLDHIDGWDFEGSVIRLHGAACDTMKLEPQASVSVTLACRVD